MTSTNGTEGVEEKGLIHPIGQLPTPVAEAAASLPAGFQTGLQQLMAQYNLTAGEVWSSVSIIIRIFQEDREGRTTQFR